MNLEHHYAVNIEWTGNRGAGTSNHRAYGRDHLLRADGKPPIEGSSDRVFHGDASRWNPEELLMSALTQCHLLSYLHVATSAGVIVTAYSDSAVGTLHTTADGGGRMTSVTLRPVVTVESVDMVDRAMSAHKEASRKCFIAASVNFPVEHEPQILVRGA